MWKDCVSNGPEGEGLTMSLPYLHTSMALHCPIKFRLFNTAYKARGGWPLPAYLSSPLRLQLHASCQVLNHSQFLESHDNPAYGRAFGTFALGQALG